MHLDELEQVLRQQCENVEGERGAWEFTIDDIKIACIADAEFDRMRVFAPIIDERDIDDEQRASMLEANFHTALDARYAISEGIVYAAFLHPLGELTEHELESALSQVANLVDTFGTTYSGGLIAFGIPSSPSDAPN